MGLAAGNTPAMPGDRPHKIFKLLLCRITLPLHCASVCHTLSPIRVLHPVIFWAGCILADI